MHLRVARLEEGRAYSIYEARPRDLTCYGRGLGWHPEPPTIRLLERWQSRGCEPTGGDARRLKPLRILNGWLSYMQCPTTALNFMQRGDPRDDMLARSRS